MSSEDGHDRQGPVDGLSLFFLDDLMGQMNGEKTPTASSPGAEKADSWVL